MKKISVSLGLIALAWFALAPITGARAQNAGANDAPLDAVAGAQVPPPNVPNWGDARLQIPAHDYAVPTTSTVIFVAPDAPDDGAGTLASPLSVGKALNQALNGTTIVFRGGVYRVGSLEVQNKTLHLQAYRDENPWLKGSVVVPA